jgi:hypothetical protein
MLHSDLFAQYRQLIPPSPSYISVTNEKPSLHWASDGNTIICEILNAIYHN